MEHYLFFLSIGKTCASYCRALAGQRVITECYWPTRQSRPRLCHTARDAAIDKAVRLTKLHHKQVAPRVKVRSQHRRWSVDMEPILKRRYVAGVQFDYVGEMDIEEIETYPLIAIDVLDERALLFARGSGLR